MRYNLLVNMYLYINLEMHGQDGYTVELFYLKDTRLIPVKASILSKLLYQCFYTTKTLNTVGGR